MSKIGSDGDVMHALSEVQCLQRCSVAHVKSCKLSRKLSNHPIVGLDKESLNILPSIMKLTK